MGQLGGGTLAIQAVHGPSCCSTQRSQRTNVCTLAKILLAMSTVNGTLPAHCNFCYISTLFLGQHFTYDAASTLD